MTAPTTTRRHHLLGVLVLTLLAAVIATPVPGVAVSAQVPNMTSAVASDVLRVAPGKLGSLKMGTTTRKAKKRGWIRWDAAMGAWGAGPRAYRIAGDSEVFKAYPDTVRKGRVLSMHAMGNVITAKGIRAAGLEYPDPTPGSTLADLQAAYPKLRYLGMWDSPQGDALPVYTTGGKKRGWLDFYLDPTSGQVVLMQVRNGKVKWGRVLID
jgi:hypothetical protein